ncbi:MAG: LON peptidase substrate-binding domain-containing protein, partial [Ilumatobacteraceae bacterium]
YRELVRHCLSDATHEFGVVLIDRGHEVGGGDIRRQVGTVARLVQVAELSGDRYAVIAVGVRRIRVTGWLADDPYPLAEVSDWPDEDEPDDPDLPIGQLLLRVTEHVRRSAALAIELGDVTGDPTIELSDELVASSYQLAAMAPLGGADVFDLLSAPGPRRRLQLMAQRLDDVDAMHRFRLAAEGQPPDAP